MSEAILKTEFGDIRIKEEASWSYGEKEVHLLADFEDEDMRTQQGEGLAVVLFESPDKEEIEADDVCRVILHRNLPEFGEKEAPEVLRLLQFASHLAGLIDAATADQRSEAAQKEREEERQREEQEKAEQERIEEREEIMLQELVGEKVKVRHRAYKTMCYGEVKARPTAWDDDEEETEWRPVIAYTDQGYTRDGGVGSYVRLDVKTSKGWRTVWDDGKDDLPEYDRNVKLPQVKAWDG